MSLPYWIGNGSYAFGSGAITPGQPSGVVVGDILVFLGETDAGDALSASGWTAAPDSPSDQPADEGTRLTVLWRRATGSDALHTNDSGNHQSGRIMAFRNCVGTGVPWDVTNKTVGEGPGVSIAGDTTTEPDTLAVIGISGASPDGGFSGWSNADLDNLTPRFENTTGAGNGGCVAGVTGEAPDAGVIGATAASTDGDEEWAGWIGFLKSAAPDSGSGSEEGSGSGSEEPSSEEPSSEETPISSEEPEEPPNESDEFGVNTYQFDTLEPDEEDRIPIPWYVAWQVMDNGGESISKVITAIRPTGKFTDAEIQIHAASPGDEIDIDDIENGTNARATIAIADSTQKTRYERSKVKIKNLSLWTARMSGTDPMTGDVRDRLDELIIEGRPHGVGK